MVNVEPVQRRDYLAIAFFTLLLYGIVLAVGGPLTMHEGVLAQTTKAMLANHDWLAPRYGDAPWLERPPLPQWISCGVCALIGRCDQEWQVRISPTLAGLTTVLITTWLAGRLFGRVTGILSGLMLATMYNFIRYATLSEADIFLAPIIAGTLACFANMELLRAPDTGESRNFFGSRPWPVLGFFALLGMTNLAKGLVFGTVIALAPVGAFLVWNLRWQSVERYLWLWGWLVFFAIALPWPMLVIYSGYPDAVEVWKFDLVGRLNQNYLGEPPWYYFACLSWVPQPWTIPALAGLCLTFPRLWKNPSPAQRFVWCWAWMPLLVFSLSQGKHHHYMLHYLAPWAMLSAQAVVWTWQRYAAGTRPTPVLIGGFAALFACYGVGFYCKGAYLHRSRADTEFLVEARRLVPYHQPLMVNSADEALEGLRMQFYVGDSVHFLHNLSYVRDDRVQAAEVFVVTRYNRIEHLKKYGKVEPMLRCTQSRRETSAADRWTLFHVRLHDDFQRKNTAVRISPMQAMYRESGPDFD